MIEQNAGSPDASVVFRVKVTAEQYEAFEVAARLYETTLEELIKRYLVDSLTADLQPEKVAARLRAQQAPFDESNPNGE